MCSCSIICPITIKSPRSRPSVGLSLNKRQREKVDRWCVVERTMYYSASYTEFVSECT